MNRIHRFENDGRSCVITDPRPPRYWNSFMWSEHGYCAQVSQIGHGASFCVTEKAEMCRVNSQDARYVYLRDDDTGTCWNVGEGPLLEPVEDYACEYSIAYTHISSRKDGIRASWRLFVPHDGYNEVWTLTLANESGRRRNVSLFSAVSFELEGFDYPRYYEMYRCCESAYDEDLNGIFCHARHPFAPHARYNGYLASTERVHAADGDLAQFFGPIGSFQRPEVVVQGRDCTGSRAALFVLGGVLQHRLCLAPGEERAVHVLLGVSESLEEARQTVARYADAGEVEASLARSERFILGQQGSLSAGTPEDRVNDVMNDWLKRQVSFCLVGKKGVRDNLQIAVGLLNYRPARARAEILEALRHQFRDGHAVLTWYPYDDTRYSDQPFWIAWSVVELVKETGDYGILDLEAEYQDGGKGTVLEHVQAGLERLLKDRGPNGLTKLWFADWNDALNVTDDPEAESVMLSAQLCLALKEVGALAERLGDGATARRLAAQYDEMRAAVNEKAWDGEWYARVLSAHGPIGSRQSEGSTIYLNPQVWAVLAGLVPEERLPLVLASVDRMEQPFGFPINAPAYQEYSPHVGRMGGMLPGLFENGGVYCHATAFKIMMDCALGRGEQAVRSLLKIMPDSDENPVARSGAEPFAFTNCYATHPYYYGKSYLSWMTGTSAWALRGLYEGILGLRRDYDGLRVDPCLPPAWGRAEATRAFRGTRYHVAILNPDHVSKGRVEVQVDGRAVEGNLLPLFDDDTLHEVAVVVRA